MVRHKHEVDQIADKHNKLNDECNQLVSELNFSDRMHSKLSENFKELLDKHKKAEN